MDPISMHIVCVLIVGGHQVSDEGIKVKLAWLPWCTSVRIMYPLTVFVVPFILR